MKEKILLSLKNKYKNLGFGDKAFEGVADYLQQTVTKESQIETAIGGVEALLKAFQGDTDKVRSEKAAIQRELDELKAKKNEGNFNKPEGNSDKDTPAWAQALIDSHEEIAESNKKLMEEVNALKTGKVSESRIEKLNNALKDTDSNFQKPVLSAFQRMTFQDDADFENYLSEINESVKTYLEDTSSKNLGIFPKPMGNKERVKKEASKEEVKEIVDGMKI